MGNVWWIERRSRGSCCDFAHKFRSVLAIPFTWCLWRSFFDCISFAVVVLVSVIRSLFDTPVFALFDYHVFYSSLFEFRFQLFAIFSILSLITCSYPLCDIRSLLDSLSNLIYIVKTLNTPPPQFSYLYFTFKQDRDLFRIPFQLAR